MNDDVKMYCCGCNKDFENPENLFKHVCVSTYKKGFWDFITEESEFNMFYSGITLMTCSSLVPALRLSITSSILFGIGMGLLYPFLRSKFYDKD